MCFKYVLNENMITSELREIKIFIGNKNIINNLYRIKTFVSIMCESMCLFVDFMFKSESLTDFTNLFSPSNFVKNDKLIFEYLKVMKR